MYKDKPKIVVFNQDTLSHVGIITKYTSLVWEPKFSGVGEFEFWCELCEENIELVKAERIVWIGEDEFGIILGFQESIDEKGSKKLDVKGTTLNEYLLRRIVWGTHISRNKKETEIMKALVNENFVSPSDSARKFNFMLVEDTKDYGKQIDYQQTGGIVGEELEKLCDSSESQLGFKLYVDIKNKKIKFKTECGKDRTRGNTEGNNIVVLSTDLKDILSSTYEYNCKDEKNVALVAGEDKGDNRKKVIAGDTLKKGLYRKELYVDARDLRKDDGNGKTFTDAEYESMLNERGNSKLGEYVVEENFNATIRNTGFTNYSYGVDYNIGDKVTLEDKVLCISLDATILNIQESWQDKGYTLKVVFGYSRLKLPKKIKRMLKD